MAAAEPLRVVIVDDHEVVAEGVRSWCAGADPPIDLLYAGPHPRALWTGSGAQAAVVILDLQLNQGKREFDSLQRLVDAERRVVVYTQDATRGPPYSAFGSARSPTSPSPKAGTTSSRPFAPPPTASRTRPRR